MAKYNTQTVAPKKPKGFMTSSGETTLTHEGNLAFVQDAESELFRLAVTNMGNDKTFYESGDDRADRFRNLIHEVTVKDPEFIAGFVPFLRGYSDEEAGEIVGMNMRTASTIMGVEYGVALEGFDRSKLKAHQMPRAVLASALKRADEPGEAVAYYLTHYGKNLPMWFKRGIADSLQPLYTQYSALKYNGGSRGVSMRDVIELTHPIPRDAEQAQLFKYLTYRYEPVSLEGLDMIRRRRELDRLPMEDRRALLGTDALEGIGATWEWISGWLPNMDAEIWESVIPSMGYMALLRNLRNFEEAKVSEKWLNYVAEKLMDPQAVMKSRQFPYRFLSAYKELKGTRFMHPLEKALEYATKNVPYLSGRTLILQDISGSMQWGTSGKSKMTLAEAGALFGAVLKQRGQHVDWVPFATGYKVYNPTKTAVLPTMDEFNNKIQNTLGGGTETFKTFKAVYDNHDRIIIITDMQAFPANRETSWYEDGYGYAGDMGGSYLSFLDTVKAPIYSFDVAGYKPVHIEDDNGRYTLAGLTDTTFKQIELLESGKAGKWPWL